jgi:hypothetical protein
MPSAINTFKRAWIICDIDGTVADTTHRDHILKDDEGKPFAYPDYDAYTALCPKDKPIHPVIALIEQMSEWYNITWVTARSEKYYHLTHAWLGINVYVYRGAELYMRRDGDHRHDWEIKRDIYRQRFADRKVLLVLDDRRGCVDMWRSLRLTCLQPKDTP